MKEKSLPSSLTARITRAGRDIEICKERFIQNRTYSEIGSKFNLGTTQILRILRTFEEKNPEMVAEMKKKGEELTPESYKALREEVLRLRSELAHEKLRADFYEEMVAFGKEVYGIDLKKVGTK